MPAKVYGSQENIQTKIGTGEMKKDDIRKILSPDIDDYRLKATCYISLRIFGAA
jgi:hypothetical protein